MERKRTNLFVALLLLSPLTIALPLIPNLSPAATTAYTALNDTVLTYTSAATQTYYRSTMGTALIQAPIDLPPKVVGFIAPKGRCSQYTYPLTVTSGSVLNLQLTSTNPANMYLLPTYAYETSPDGCELTVPASALLFQTNFTAYTLRWTAPENGMFYIILTGPTTVITLTDEGSSQPVLEPSNITYALSTQTSVQDYVSTRLSTATYTATSMQPFYLQKQTRAALGVLTLLGLIACLSVTVFAEAQRRRP